MADYSSFSKVIYQANQPEIAKVNRKDGTLYLNSKIWSGLPEAEQEYVLLHEKGHLVMQTTDEFKANEYAVKNFVPVRTLTNKELGKRIVVMRSILSKAESGFAMDAISGVFKSLPLLGIGSKAREAEAAANADAQVKVIAAQTEADKSKSNTTIIISVLVGVILIVIVTLYFTLKK